MNDRDLQELQYAALGERERYCMAYGIGTRRKHEADIIRSTIRRAVEQIERRTLTQDMTDEEIAKSIGGILLWWFAKELLLFLARFIAQRYWPYRPIGMA